jgi:DNA-binding CsgD family transcriptional regulator
MVLDPEGPSVVTIRGPAGIGKSRLLDEVVSGAAGWDVVRIYGGPAVRPFPFGAVSHLLDPDGLPDDPTALFAHVRQCLIGRSPTHLLVVDDAHDLDDATAGVIHQIGAHREARLLLTAREPPGPPPSLSAVLGGPDSERIDLLPLDRPATVGLVEQLVGCRVDPELAEQVWERTLGSPLFVAVLVTAAETAGALQRVDGAARLRGVLPVDSLHDLVRTRMTGLGSPARTALELVTIGGRLPVDVVDSVAGAGACEATIGTGYLSRWSDGTVDVAHPLYAESLKAEMLPTRLQSLSRALVEGLGPVLQTDRIRRAVLTLDAGLELAPDAAAAAAIDAVARLDHQLGERLASAALDGDPTSVRASLALARARVLQGRGEEADAVLAAASPAHAEEKAEVAIVRAHVWAFLLGRADDAIELLRSAAADLPDDLRAPLDADRSLYGAMHGSLRDTIEAAEAVRSNPSATDVTKLRAMTNLTLARTLLGRLEGLMPVLDEALDRSERQRWVRPLARLQNGLTLVNALYLSGRIAEAREHSSRRLDESPGDPHPVWQEWLALMLDAEGRFEEAARLQRRAIDGFGRADPFRLKAQTVGMLGMHYGQMGQVPADLSAVVEDAESRSGGEPRLVLWTGRGRAWLASVQFGPECAADIARAAGHHAADGDHLSWAALAFHDVVRFGEPETVRDELAQLVAEMSGVPLLEAMRDHAAALADDNAVGLAHVASEFVSVGALALAVEVWCQAAKLHEAHGEASASQRAATKAAILSRHSPALRTPALEGTPSGLTDRELDVAAQVVSGATSREAAAALYVSARTVDNHLASVYRKLGIGGRDELAAVLGVPVQRDLADQGEVAGQEIVTGVLVDVTRARRAVDQTPGDDLGCVLGAPVMPIAVPPLRQAA